MSAANTVKPGWFSIKGASVYTGFSVTGIRAAMDKGLFPVRRVAITGSGAKDAARIKREHLDAWIEGREINIENAQAMASADTNLNQHQEPK